MPVRREASCRGGEVRLAVPPPTPQPSQLCDGAIGRKTAGGGGYAINLGAIAGSLEVLGRESLAIWRAELERMDDNGISRLETSPAQRHFCRHCASALWLHDPTWPDLIHPFASAIDSELPVPPARVHLMLRYKPSWVLPAIGPDDLCFDEYPAQSIEDWHRSRGLWVA